MKKIVAFGSALICVAALSSNSTARAAELSLQYDVHALSTAHPLAEKTDQIVSSVGIGQTDGITEVGVASTAPYSGSNAMVIGYAEYGSLHAITGAGAYMNITGTTGVSRYNILNQTVPVSSSGDMDVSFTDNLYFGSGLPYGTPINVVFGFGLHDAAQGDYIPNAWLDGVTLEGDVPGAQVRLFDNLLLNLQNQEVYTPVTVYAGIPVPISEDLVVFSEADIGLDDDGCYVSYVGGCLGFADVPDVFDSWENTDAFDTASFSVEVLTPGVTYTSDSGTIYQTTLPLEGGDPATPAPEPTSFALLGAGLLGLGVIRHRRLA
jgi:hypothetical protein